jgi:hypothetical protein
LGDSVNTITENKETLLEARRDCWYINKCREDEVYDHVSSSELGTEPESKDG